nr:ankyrin repeat domain-containing protein 17-like [Lytechinus pictus]
MSSHGDGGSPTMSSILRRIPSVRERARRGSLGQISGGAAIHDAVAKGKIHLAKFILDAVEGQAVVNSRDSHGKTPLIRAMKIDDGQTRLKVVQLLLQHGANVNHRDNMGRTALSYAAEFQYKDVIKILVKNNVDPNIVDNNGNTPLIYCSMVGNATGILILTRSFRRLGLDVDKLNGEGMSALMLAAKIGDMECVKLLTHEGKASLDQRDQFKNMTAAEWAREGGCSTPEMEAFLPKIRRQSKPTDTSSTKQDDDPRANLKKNESIESSCSSNDGYSPRANDSKESSSEELSPRQNYLKGTIAVPTPPSYRKNPQLHMDALSRRFHALHPVKNIHDIPGVRKQIIEMKRASLPEVTNPDSLGYHCEEETDNLNQDSDNRSGFNTIFIKRTKPSVPRRPLSAINRNSNQRQSKSFDGCTYERSSNSDEDISVQKKKMGQSLSNLYLENPHSKNLLNLSFLSRSTEALSPMCSSPDTASMRQSVNSTTHINVDIDNYKSPQIKNMLRVDLHGQGDQTPRLPPLSPKRVVTGQ